MSRVRKRSVTIHGHRTSFSLEDAFYDLIVDIADSRKITVAALIAEIDASRDRNSNLSSAFRLLVLDWVKYRSKRP